MRPYLQSSRSCAAFWWRLLRAARYFSGMNFRGVHQFWVVIRECHPVHRSHEEVLGLRVICGGDDAVTSWRYLVLDAVARRLPILTRGGGDTTVIFSPGHLGDILHVVPMLRALREGMPGAKTIWLVGPWSESLARRYSGLVDEIQVFGPHLPCYTRGKRAWMQSVWDQGRLALALRAKGVHNLIGPVDGVGRFMANAICPTRWLGIGDGRPPRVRKEIETMIFPYEKDRYEADSLCGLLKPLGIDVRAERLEYGVAAGEKEEAREFLKRAGVDLARPLAMMAPGSGWSGKNWLSERFGDVARWMVEEKGFQVAWIGGKGEEWLIPESGKNDFNWIGKTTLPLLAAVMEGARLFVGNDSGLLHVAAALGVPTVSIWGPTSPGKWGPKGTIHQQIRNMERCEGCIYWDYREICRHDHECMKSISVEMVCSAIQHHLEATIR